MTSKRCHAQLHLGDDTYVCDRPKSHAGKHRERMYGADQRGQYGAVIRWRRWKDRRT